LVRRIIKSRKQLLLKPRGKNHLALCSPKYSRNETSARTSATFNDFSKGITSTTFKTVPDTPFNTFELTLPEGPYSALAANKNLCALTHAVTTKKTVKVKSHGHTRKVVRKTTKQVGESLIMPTEFVAQNGAVLKQNTKISVTGCAKSASKQHGKHKKGKKGKK
jgi:hypothetical protein